MIATCSGDVWAEPPQRNRHLGSLPPSRRPPPCRGESRCRLSTRVLQRRLRFRIDAVQERSALEASQKIVDGEVGHADSRGDAGASDVRRQDEVRRGEQRTVGGDRLLLEDVERGAGKAARVQGLVA